MFEGFLVEALRGLDEEQDDPVNDWELAVKYAMREAADAIEELSMKLHGDEAAIAGMKREIARMVVAGKFRWIPVTEKNHPKAYEPVMVIYIGCHDALPHRDCTAYWSEEEDLWRWAETNDKVNVTITHYMPLPPLPEPPKEEAM